MRLIPYFTANQVTEMEHGRHMCIETLTVDLKRKYKLTTFCFCFAKRQQWEPYQNVSPLQTIAGDFKGGKNVHLVPMSLTISLPPTMQNTVPSPHSGQSPSKARNKRQLPPRRRDLTSRLPVGWGGWVSKQPGGSGPAGPRVVSCRTQHTVWPRTSWTKQMW